MHFSISAPLKLSWNRDILEQRLVKLSDPLTPIQGKTYIKADLSIAQMDTDSFLFKTAKLFGAAKRVYDTDLEKPRSVLLALRPQIDRTNDSVLIHLFDKAVAGFNLKAKGYEIDLQKCREIKSQENAPTTTQKSYIPPDKRNYPPILQRNPSVYYPVQFLTKPSICLRDPFGHMQSMQLKQRNDIAAAYRYAELKDVAAYEKSFNQFLVEHYDHLDRYEGVWDLHDCLYQDLALRLTAGWSDRELRQPKSRAIRHLIRARNFAIGARSEIGWDGLPITSSEQRQLKQKTMEMHWKSLILRDWAGVKELQELSTWSGLLSQKITVTTEDTQTAVERLAKSYSPAKICWVNMANAHKVGGDYQMLGEGQEEVVTTNSDAIVVLTNAGELDLEGDVFYCSYVHIPPGGNYFHKMRFITGEQVFCQSIVHAFADFRDAYFSERQDYVDASGKLACDSLAYRERIKLDMRGVLRTAIAEKQEVLVLSATGCGALEHDPWVEAQAWKEVLNEASFKNRFGEVVFAILPDAQKPDNVRAFQTTFA